MDGRLFNVVQVGVAFLCIFAALNSSSFIVETVINEIADSGRVDRHDGYVSSSIIYLFFTLTGLFAAPVTTALGAKWAMVLSASTYGIYQAGFLFLNQPFLYASSALLGCGAAVLWTAQGNYMCLNSNNETAGRNSGVFWAISQVCLIFGGIFMFAVFYTNESPHIAERTIRIIYGCFTTLTVIGVVLLTGLRIPRPPTPESPPQSPVSSQPTSSDVEATIPEAAAILPDKPAEPPITIRQQLKIIEGTLRLGATKRMLFMILAFSYTGFILSFWSGIYPTCIASTLRLAYNTKCLLALNAITQGLGQAVAGFLFGILGSKTKWLGRYRIIALGTVVHFLTFAVAYVNFPAEASLGKTDAPGLIEPSIALALFGGFALGFGDACWNTQIYAHLIANYQTNSAEAFCLFRFFQSLITAIAFYYSKLLLLPWHLLILTVGSILGVFGYYMADERLADAPLTLADASHED